jgi:hypothetical protein
MAYPQQLMQQQPVSGNLTHSSFGGKGVKALAEQNSGKTNIPSWLHVLFPQFTAWSDPEGAKEAWFGTPERIHDYENFEPEQWQAIQQALQQAMGQIQNPGQGFEPFENQARSDLQTKTLPGLAERFTSMGSNALSSPAFGGQLGQLGNEFESGLSALKGQHALQNRQQGFGALQNIGLQRRYTPMQQAAQPGFFDKAANAAVKYATAGMGGFGPNETSNASYANSAKGGQDLWNYVNNTKFGG